MRFALADHRGQATALIRLGQVRVLTGDHHHGALGNLREALRLSEDLGDQLGQANALIYLGRARGMTGDHAGAIRDVQRPLDLSRRP